MTTTVTTTTVTTVTALGLTGALGIMATLVLITFLVCKELASASAGERAIRWSRVLNVGIVPLLVAFAVIVAGKVAQVL